ncbi:unnamed protein product [Euphydryas editha]|uniref:Uncharacterized protein n=1 Tax=Euphydryas editha TaxID=104508 RepID=A0AAU9V6H2_EUPED|nr:unnamed protein product [Euphydryas editha]
MNMEQLTSNTSPKAGSQILANREIISSVPTSTSDQTQMERLRTKINELVDYIKDKNNVHGEIRRLAKSIETAYNLTLKGFNATLKKSPIMSVSSTQTSPCMISRPKVPVTPNDTSQERNNTRKRPLSRQLAPWIHANQKN